MKADTVSNKAIGYLRVSTDKQEMSMQLQEEKIRKYCEDKGLDVVFLKDPDVSGKTRIYDRPGGV